MAPENDPLDPDSITVSRYKAYMQALAEAPISELYGIIGPNGLSGAFSGNEQWNLRFKFENWKFKNGELQHKKLSLERR